MSHEKAALHLNSESEMMNMTYLICLVAIVAICVIADVLIDVFLDYRDIKLEQEMADQRERFGISEDSQDALIDDFGYPEYLEKLK